MDLTLLIGVLHRSLHGVAHRVLVPVLTLCAVRLSCCLRWDRSISDKRLNLTGILLYSCAIPLFDIFVAFRNVLVTTSCDVTVWKAISDALQACGTNALPLNSKSQRKLLHVGRLLSSCRLRSFLAHELAADHAGSFVCCGATTSESSFR
jgi:hypothetical protein